MPRPSLRTTAIVTLLLLAAGGWIAARSLDASSSPGCLVADGTQTYHLDRQQVANALIITAAARDNGLEHHAVTVALAAAIRESQLRNLKHGDRDSLGLFQQRPSQGWGTPAEILDPHTAASRFFLALRRVDRWQAMPVTQAAQTVQHSATPTAYAAVEPEGRAIARATTGERPGTLRCA